MTNSNMAYKDYLQEYDAAPEAEKYPLVQAWIKSQEHCRPFFKQLRQERPVLVTPECTLIANFVDVRDMLQMPKIFTVDLYKPKMAVTGPDDGYLMAHDDDALHYREKSLMQGLLNRDDLPEVRKMIAADAAKVLKDAEGSIDFVNDYCRMIPVMLVQNYFGLDGVDEQDLIRWSYWNQYDAFHNQPHSMLSDSDHDVIVKNHDKASHELVTYIAVLMARKLVSVKVMGLIYMVLSPIKKLFLRILGMTPRDKRDNMVTRMVKTKYASEVDFPLTRVGTNAGGLLIGAIETTAQAVAQVVEFFLDNPALLKKAKDLARGSDTAAFDGMVWEGLRFRPFQPDIFRLSAEDYIVGKGTDYETKIEKGTIVRLLTYSAMFDPFSYEDPDDFKHDRTFYHHFVFGFGPHECLGKYVGMEMIPEMVRQALLLDNLHSNEPISYVNKAFFPDRDGPFPEHYQVQWNAFTDA